MNRNPDIQRLLAALRGEIQTDAQAQSSEPVPTESNSKQPGFASGSTTIGIIPVAHSRSATNTPQPPNTEHFIRQDSSQTAVTPDSSSISTWPSAIKFVSKHIVTNDKAETKIKHMITEQHKHERDWWQKRQVIVNKQSGREGNQLKAAELLRSLGGQDVPIAASDPKVDKEELDAFDHKVHKSLTAMSSHYDKELRQLGVPFYSIKHDLVVQGDNKAKDVAVKGKIGQEDLKQLQRRMLIYLEELFGDEADYQ